MDLAGAYESIGNISLAREAFNRARTVYPASAQVAWSYGNFLLRQGDDASGFAQINHAVQADPSLALPAVSQAWHKTQDANVLLNRVLPATQDAYFQAIDFMAANGQPAGALGPYTVRNRKQMTDSRYCVRAATPLLREQPGTAIVNVASVAGSTGVGSSMAYAAAKAGVITMTKSLARALAPQIRVNAISPGLIRTHFAGRCRVSTESHRRLVTLRYRPQHTLEPRHLSRDRGPRVLLTRPGQPATSP